MQVESGFTLTRLIKLLFFTQFLRHMQYSEKLTQHLLPLRWLVFAFSPVANKHQYFQGKYEGLFLDEIENAHPNLLPTQSQLDASAFDIYYCFKGCFKEMIEETL